MPVRPIPAGYATLTPGCTLRGAAEAIVLYQQLFGARTRVRLDAPNGAVAHAELEIGDSVLMLGEASAESPAHGVHLMMYLEDCDALFARAVKAGMEAKQAPALQFWGDRTARLRDRFGNEWYLATHVEDVPEDEMKRRMAKAMGG